MLTYPKMYVLVRCDLSETYRIVQGSHALAQYSIDFPEMFKVWNNRTLVFLGLHNLKALREMKEILELNSKAHSCFHEPDLENQLTGIACYDTGELFKHLKLA